MTAWLRRLWRQFLWRCHVCNEPLTTGGFCVPCWLNRMLKALEDIP